MIYSPRRSTLANRLNRHGRRAWWLVLALLLAWAISLPVAYLTTAVDGMIAATMAAAVVLAAGIAALAVDRVCRSPEMLLPRVLGGMMLRMGIPLAATMAIYYNGGPLVDAGMVYYLLAFYFVMLVAETTLTLPATGAATGVTGETTETS